MKYFDATFWRMSAIFLLIVIGALTAIYQLKSYEERRLLNPDNSATVLIQP